MNQIDLRIVAEDKASPGRDPTGTASLRESFATKLRRRWRLVEVAVREAVGEKDVFALHPDSHSIVSGGSGQLTAFQGWLDATMAQLVLGADKGLWASGPLLSGYKRGVARGGRLTGTSLPKGDVSLLVSSTISELQGIIGAVSQRASRSFANALMLKASPQVAARAIVDVLRLIANPRSEALASYAIVRAHAAGTLDALEFAGVQRVGIEPEHVPARRMYDSCPTIISDARRKAVTAYRIRKATRAERKLEAVVGTLVNVITAEDDKVCPTCEEIADDGPYDINTARGLIPAHPHCRCAFVAAGTSDAFNPNQKRDPKGSETGGQWTSNVILTPVDKRAFTGEPAAPATNPPNKQETGALGESIAMEYLRRTGLKDVRPLNAEVNNFPIDVIHRKGVVEVKAGLASNSVSAQQWRTTIGQPGPTETEWLRKASPEAKAKWNEKKARAIIARKKAAQAQFERELKRKLDGDTVSVIIDPRTKIADIFHFKGFHSRVAWRSDEAHKHYVGSFRYARA